MSKFLLSIIIPTYNSEKYISSCLNSIAKVKDTRVEFILVDGLSTDSTMAIVQKKRSLFTEIISEKDSGQSDAFNKGFHIAQGDYLTWLNSDDILNDQGLVRLLDILERKEHEWYAVDSLHIDEYDNLLKANRAGNLDKLAIRFGIINVGAPSSIFSKKLYFKCGNFSEDFHYCMDTEYWWRIYKKGIQFKRISIYLFALRLHKDAKTASTILDNFTPSKMRAERLKIKELYFSEINQDCIPTKLIILKLLKLFNLNYMIGLLDTVFNKRAHFSKLFK